MRDLLLVDHRGKEGQDFFFHPHRILFPLPFEIKKVHVTISTSDSSLFILVGTSLWGLLWIHISLGAVIAIFSGIIFNGEKIVGSKNYLPSTSCTLSLYHLVSVLEFTVHIFLEFITCLISNFFHLFII